MGTMGEILDQGHPMPLEQWRDTIREYWGASNNEERELKAACLINQVANFLEYMDVPIYEPMDYQEFIEKLFDAMNRAFFDDGLPRPLLFAKEIMTLDHEPVAGMFHAPEQSRLYDEPAITINPEESKLMKRRFGFDSVYEVMAETLLHEMTHYYNYLQGIEDADESGIHNENFKTAAEAHGQECATGANGPSTTGVSLAGWATLDGALDHDADYDLREALGIA